jgi:hypothetical protein
LVTCLSFYGQELLASCPTPNLEDHPLQLSVTTSSIYSQLHAICVTHKTVKSIYLWKTSPSIGRLVWRNRENRGEKCCVENDKLVLVNCMGSTSVFLYYAFRAPTCFSLYWPSSESRLYITKTSDCYVTMSSVFVRAWYPLKLS